MAIKGKNVHSDYVLTGVFATITAYLSDRRNGAAAVEGDSFYDTTLNYLRTYDGSSWSPAGQNGNSAGSLDDAAQIGVKITNATAIEIEASSPSSNLFILDSNGTGTADVFDISQAAGATHLINMTQGGTGKDIDGTSSLWSASKAGVIDAASLTLADAKTLVLGTSSDGTLQFDGTTLILAAGTDDLLWEIGDSAATQLSWDIKWYGNTANGADFLYFDASENLVYTTGVDMQFKDSDVLAFGTGAGAAGDFSFTYDGTDLLFETATADLIWKIGATTNMDIIIYGDTATDLITFDTSAELVHFDGFDLQLKDTDILQFGDKSGGDVNITWDTSNLLIEAGTQDTGQIRFGSANAMDVVFYDNAASGTITYDVSTSIIDCNGWDVRYQDDDYILLGDSATAGATTDGTIRWDATNSTIEVIGVIQFEDNVTMDGNLDISGTLTMSGSFAPGSISLGDTEIIYFGDGNDYKISTAGSTAALIITAVNANDAVHIGDGSVATDFLIDNITVAGADVWWDQSADTANGVWYFGKDDAGVDVIFYGATSGDNVTFDYSVDRMQFEDIDLTMMDNTNLLFGDGSSGAGDFKMYSDGADLFIAEISSVGKGIEIGINGKGLDFKMYGETNGDYCEFDQSADAYLFEDIDIALGDGTYIFLGDPLGTGDFKISSTAAVLSIEQVVLNTGTIAMGVDGRGIDQKWFGEIAGDFMLWDQDGNTRGALVFEDTAIRIDGANANYSLAISTDAFLITATDHANAKVTWGDNGTNGLDQEWLSVTASNLLEWNAGTETLAFTDVLCTMTGADSRGTILAITGNDTTGNTDTVTINSDGTGSGLKITCDGTTSVGATLLSAASQTTSLGIVDGVNGNWIGADDVGMLHLKADTALAHAGASQLQIVNTAQPISAGQGFLARFVDTGTAQTNAYGVEVTVTATTGALNVASGYSTFADKVTATTGVQCGAISRTPTTDGTGNGLIADGSKMITVADGGNAAFWLTLPTPTPGNIIFLLTSGDSTGFEIRSSTPASVGINGGTGANAESAIAAAITMIRCVCVSATEWICSQWDADGDESKVVAAA